MLEFNIANFIIGAAFLLFILFLDTDWRNFR